MQSIIDQNLLEAVRLYLEPLPDHSLPGLTIQRTVFECLGKVAVISSMANCSFHLP
jgi:transcription factor SPN1